MAAKLNQAGLFRMQRERELLQPFPHRLPEAPGVGLVLEADNDIVRSSKRLTWRTGKARCGFSDRSSGRAAAPEGAAVADRP
jgi:hypothetical protein